MIKFLKKIFSTCEHKWKVFKEEKKGFICIRKGEQVGNSRTVILKAYKCKECGEFKFWYSLDMNDGDYFSQLKEDFEFNIINEIEEI